MTPAPLSDPAITEALRGLPGWTREGDKLHKQFRCADFREALAFIVRIGFEAEQRNHHPELSNVWASVTLALCTHDAGNKITALDTELAAAINAVAPAG